MTEPSRGRAAGSDRLPPSLDSLAMATGLSCAAIGAVHLALGIASVPGERGAGATVDSRERFYGAVFGAYGLAWLWAARQAPDPDRAVRALALTLLAGGLGRLPSIAVHGRPHWFQLVLTGIELALPVPFLSHRFQGWARGADPLLPESRG